MNQEDVLDGERVPLVGDASHASDLLESKLRPPPERPASVDRTVLIDRLSGPSSPAIVSVVAPAGYGKSTLLSQWADRASSSVAWLSVDDRDNDPRVLLNYIARALDAAQPMSDLVFRALSSPASSVIGAALPRLANAFSSMSVPVLLVLDDVHLLTNVECRAALSVLVDSVPQGSRFVLSGRDEPPIRVARLRAEGRLVEIGPDELSLSPKESAALLRAADVALDDEDVAELHRRTEGWAVGLYLSALSIRQGGAVDAPVLEVDGADRLVSEYLQSEFLERLPDAQRAFLLRSAVLDRMSAPLCDSVLGLTDAAEMLAELARSNLLVVPLDRRGEWYRYHHMLRDFLRAELARREPGLIPTLLSSAARWFEAQGRSDEAVEFSVTAGDVDTVARLVEDRWLPLHWEGRRDTLERWANWLDHQGGVKRHPIIGVMAGFLYSTTGRPAEAERWADLVERWEYDDPAWAGDAATEASAAMLRALNCRYGIDQLRRDVDEAARKYALAGITTPTPTLYRGIAGVAAGDDIDECDRYFRQAISLSEPLDAHEPLVAALFERSLLAMKRGDWGLAGTLAERAEQVVEDTRSPGAEEILAWAMVARVAAHRADKSAAQRALTRVHRLRPTVAGPAVPVICTQMWFELVRTCLDLGDAAGARTMMDEATDLLGRRPDLGLLVEEADELQTRIARTGRPETTGASRLTTAELRVLPWLATHMTYPQIAAELFVSTHTIHAQVRSIFRKLAATSRGQAVAQARDLLLIE